MNLPDDLQNLSKRIKLLKENIKTEEATKNAFVMPFIQSLGYDIFNPIEVIPEYEATIGEKREKVDYCIQKDGQPIIIIECKNWKEDVKAHFHQLGRYFSFVKAKFGIITNGIVYNFYTDIDDPNKMDQAPFLVVDFENLKENSINELKKFHKSNFDVEKIFDAAGELKYYNEIKKIYQEELIEPSDELVKFFTKKVYKKIITEKVLNQFKGIVKKALTHKINEIINDRLTSAITKDNDIEVETTTKSNLLPHEIIVFKDEEKGIYTTQEEMNGFNIIVDILKDSINIDRIIHRDFKSFFGVLLDNNIQKTICRLRFNNVSRILSLIDANKNEEKIQIEKIEHIYKYSARIIESALIYEKDTNTNTNEVIV